MGVESTRNDIERLRADFDRQPRESAIHLAQRLAWYSMQLALDKKHAESEATWVEALRVAEHVLTDPGPSQFERTELIRIGAGTARCMVEAGRPEQALVVLAKAEDQYQRLAAAATDPNTVLALRGTILTGRWATPTPSWTPSAKPPWNSCRVRAPTRSSCDRCSNRR